MGFVGGLFLVAGTLLLFIATDITTAVGGSGLIIAGAILVVGIDIRNAIRGK